jgi:hypothetical protein
MPTKNIVSVYYLFQMTRLILHLAFLASCLWYCHGAPEELRINAFVMRNDGLSGPAFVASGEKFYNYVTHINTLQNSLHINTIHYLIPEVTSD